MEACPIASASKRWLRCTEHHDDDGLELDDCRPVDGKGKMMENHDLVIACVVSSAIVVNANWLGFSM